MDQRKIKDRIVEAAERPARPSMTIVVPCYNEGAILAESQARIARAIQDVSAEWTFLYVDDGSTDDTWAVLR